MGESIAALAALMKGDCWIDADACALVLGMVSKKTGEPNRRGFLERIATLPSFPRRHPITGSWRKADVIEWADETARLSRVA